MTYYLIEGNYKDLAKDFHLPAAFNKAMSEDDYKDAVNKDKDRSLFASRVSDHASMCNSLLDTSLEEGGGDTLSFTQGDFDGRAIFSSLISIITPMLDPAYRNQYGDKNGVNFGHLGDETRQHELTCFRLSHFPIGNAIVLEKNAAAKSLEQRNFKILIKKELFEFMQEKLQQQKKIMDQHVREYGGENPAPTLDNVSKEEIEDSDISRLVAEYLPDEVNNITDGLIQEDGSVSSDKFAELKTRLNSNRNIDDRDNRKAAFEEILIQLTDVTEKNRLQKEMENDINFFKTERYLKKLNQIKLSHTDIDGLDEHIEGINSDFEKETLKYTEELENFERVTSGYQNEDVNWDNVERLDMGEDVDWDAIHKKNDRLYKAGNIVGVSGLTGAGVVGGLMLGGVLGGPIFLGLALAFATIAFIGAGIRKYASNKMQAMIKEEGRKTSRTEEEKEEESYNGDPSPGAEALRELEATRGQEDTHKPASPHEKENTQEQKDTNGSPSPHQGGGGEEEEESTSKYPKQ